LILAFDTETTGTDAFHGCRPFLITACNSIKNFYWWGRVNPWTREVTWEMEDIYEFLLLCKQADTIVTQNGNFDIRMICAVLEDNSIDSEPWHKLIRSKLEDTLVASHLICSGDSHNLKDLCIKYLDIDNEDELDLETAVKHKIAQIKRLPPEEQWCYARVGHKHFPAIPKQGTEFWKMDYWLAPEPCLKYGLLDAERTWQLWKIFKKEILNYDLYPVYRKRMDLLHVAYDMQTFGRHFDLETANSLLSKLDSDIEEHTYNIRKIAKISHHFDHEKKNHLKLLIHERCGIPVEFYTKGKKPQPATDKVTIQHYLDRYKHPALVELKKLKLKNKRRRDIRSISNWCLGSRTHSNLNVTGTRETRQSSSAPNDQNVHKQLKFLFQPPPGYVWICTDLVNIELRIWAYSVGNKELIEAFELGKSVHMMVMETIFPKEAEIYKAIKNQAYEKLSPELQRIFDMYGRTKNGNFSRIYGATDKKTNETYHGAKNAPDYCSLIDARFPGIKEFMKRIAQSCYVNLKNQGVFAVMTMGGYRLDVPINEPFKACNYYIQGTAGQIMGEAMVDWYNHPVYDGFDCGMNSQVHDGLDTEVPICEELDYIIKTKLEVISNAGKKYIPTCDVSYKLMYNEKNQNNPLLDPWTPKQKLLPGM